MGAQNCGAYYAVIPADVRYDRNLNPNAKLLYGEITSLSNKKGYCWATNEYFAELYGVSVRTVRRLVAQLEKQGYIRSEMVRTDNGMERRIYAGLFLRDVPGPVDNGPEDDGESWEDEPDRVEDISDRVGDNQEQTDKIDRGEEDTDVLGGQDKFVPHNKDELKKENNKTPYIPHGGNAAAPKKPAHYRITWFEAFWKRYPRKDNKQTALKSWDKLKPDRETCRLMSQALERDKASKQWTKDGGEFIPLLSTWLNQRRWENEGIDLSALPGGGAWAQDPEVIS